MPQLRCLVVLPTRDLAAQVFKVFSGLCPAVGLRAGLAAAQASVAAEAAELFGNGQDHSSAGMCLCPIQQHPTHTQSSLGSQAVMIVCGWLGQHTDSAGAAQPDRS